MQKLDQILSKTYRTLVYQEQVIEICKELAGYTGGQADNIRRIIGRKKQEDMEKVTPELKTRFIEHGGMSEEEADKLVSDISNCSEYIFNQGHSAAYGYTSYQTAYLKAHHPVEFMTALLNNEDEQEKVINYVAECKRMGIKIIPPNIRKSQQKWTFDGEGIHVGFCCIKGVGNTEIPTDVENFEDFMTIYGWINKRTIEALIKAGCFAGDRNSMLAQVAWYKDKRKSKGKLEAVNVATNQSDAYYETEVLGFAFSDILDDYDLSLTRSFDIVGGQVINIKPWQTKTGKDMGFVKVRGYGDDYDLVMFDKSYADIVTGGVYLFQVNQNKIAGFAPAKRKRADE